MTPLEKMKADAKLCNARMARSAKVGRPKKPPKATPHIAERRETVKRLSGLGMTKVAIAARLGVSRWTVIMDMKAISEEQSDV
jgi:DNA-binding CsgD family transcriptional regulator